MKYILCPGFVRSPHDGDTHFITADRLAKLYRVKLEDCYLYDRFKKYPEHCIELWPRDDGKYELPKE